jgi:hypothetical protein
MSQFKKLAYNKTFTDTSQGIIAIWKISPWKIFTILLSISIFLTIAYAYFFTSDPRDFLGTLIFYAIVIIIIIAILFVTAGAAGKFRGILTGFLIAFILILVFYYVLGAILGFFNILNFQMGGYTLWLVISFLAYKGAKRIDGELDKNDVGYALLILLILVGANLPINNTGGFLANVDSLIQTVINFI